LSEEERTALPHRALGASKPSIGELIEKFVDECEGIAAHRSRH
jgi:hypothetical protein